MTAKSNPAVSATTVTLSDSTEYNPPFRSLYVGVSGALKVTTANDEDVIFVAAPVGILPIEVKVVWSTGTAATDILGLR